MMKKEIHNGGRLQSSHFRAAGNRCIKVTYMRLCFFSSTGADFFHIPKQKNELKAVNPEKVASPMGVEPMLPG